VARRAVAAKVRSLPIGRGDSHADTTILPAKVSDHHRFRHSAPTLGRTRTAGKPQPLQELAERPAPSGPSNEERPHTSLEGGKRLFHSIFAEF
jgi:hypothetical protein